MPRDFWRYTTYDGYRKMQQEKEAVKPVDPVLPPQPTWQKPKQSAAASTPAWMGGQQSSQSEDFIPSWVRSSTAENRPTAQPPSAAPLYQAQGNPAAAQEQTAPSPMYIPDFSPRISPQLRAGPEKPPDDRTYQWWNRATEPEIKEWENNPTPGLVGWLADKAKQGVQNSMQQPVTMADLARQGYNPMAGAAPTPQQGSPEWYQQMAAQGKRQVGQAEQKVAQGATALQHAGTAVDSLVSTVFGTIDAWTKSGMLTPEEAQQFEANYNSLDQNIHPNIRSAMAREMLPRSTKQKIYKAVDWTTQHMAKPLAGEIYGSWQGSIEGAKQSGIRGFIEGADIDIKDADGNVIGTRKASVPKIMLDSTARLFVGGPLLAAYGQGIDAKMIRKAVTGAGGLIDKDAYADIMTTRDEWKAVENSAPAAYQFVAEMVTDPINVFSTAMGASAGALKKTAAKAGETAYAQTMAAAAANGLTSAGDMAGVQMMASRAAAAAQQAALVAGWSPEVKAIYDVSQAMDFIQNKGYLASSENPVQTYFMMQGMSKLSPIAMRLVGEAVGKAVNGSRPPARTNAEIAQALGKAHYDADAQAYGKLPEYNYYKDADGNLVKMTTPEYYVRMTEDALNTPMNIAGDGGRVYANAGEMISDFVNRGVSKETDFVGATEMGLGNRVQESPQPDAAYRSDSATRAPSNLYPPTTLNGEFVPQYKGGQARPTDITGVDMGENAPVGKSIGGALYAHRQYATEQSMPGLAQARAQLPPDFDYTIVKYDRGSGAITFTQSPDWDTATEPIVGASIRVTPGGKVTTRPQQADPEIYHGKEQFVAPDYRGFDVEAAKLRSLAIARYRSANPGASTRYGRSSYWEREARPVVDQYEQEIRASGMQGYAPEDILKMNRTGQVSGSISGITALTPRYVATIIKPTDTVASIGAGRAASAERALSAQGFNVTPYDIGANVGDYVRDISTLSGKQYSIVYGSNVLNVQPSREAIIALVDKMAAATTANGKTVVNYPESPRNSDVKPLEVEAILRDRFQVVKRVSGTTGAPVYEASVPIRAYDNLYRSDADMADIENIIRRDMGQPTGRQPVTAPTDAQYFSEGGNKPRTSSRFDAFVQRERRRAISWGEESGRPVKESIRIAEQKVADDILQGWRNLDEAAESVAMWDDSTEHYLIDGTPFGKAEVEEAIRRKRAAQTAQPAAPVQPAPVTPRAPTVDEYVALLRAEPFLMDDTGVAKALEGWNKSTPEQQLARMKALGWEGVEGETARAPETPAQTEQARERLFRLATEYINSESPNTRGILSELRKTATNEQLEAWKKQRAQAIKERRDYQEIEAISRKMFENAAPINAEFAKIEQRLPILAKIADEGQWKERGLIDGYVRDGDMYVFKGDAAETPRAPEAQPLAKPAVTPEARVEQPASPSPVKQGEGETQQRPEIVTRGIVGQLGPIVMFGARVGDKVYTFEPGAFSPVSSARGWEPVSEKDAANYLAWAERTGNNKMAVRGRTFRRLSSDIDGFVAKSQEREAASLRADRERDAMYARVDDFDKSGGSVNLSDLRVGDVIEWVGDGSRQVVKQIETLDSGEVDVYASPIDAQWQAGGSLGDGRGFRLVERGAANPPPPDTAKVGESEVAAPSRADVVAETGAEASGDMEQYRGKHVWEIPYDAARKIIGDSYVFGTSEDDLGAHLDIKKEFWQLMTSRKTWQTDILKSERYGRYADMTVALEEAIKRGEQVPDDILNTYYAQMKEKGAEPVKPPASADSAKVAEPSAQPSLLDAETTAPVKTAPVDTTPITLASGRQVPRADYDALWRPVEKIEFGSDDTIKRVGSGTGDDAGKTERWPARFALMELDDVIQSNMPETGTVNPAYKEMLQPRDRTGAEKERTKGQFLNPDYEEIVSTTNYAEYGVPIVAPNGTVAQGNGRTILLKMLAEDSTKWSQYQTYLDGAMKEAGISPEAKAKFNRPVLVRVLKDGITPDELFSLTKVVAPTGRLDPVSQARVDADMFDTSEMSALDPGNTIEATLAKASNDWIITKMFGRMPPTEKQTFIDPKTKKLTNAGIARIKNAWFVKVYGKKGADLLSKFETNEALKNVSDALFGSLPEMMRAESEIASGRKPAQMSLYDDLITTTDNFLDMREAKAPLAEYIAQSALPGISMREPMTASQIHLLTIFDELARGNRVALRETLKTYADKVIQWTPQMNMFGETLTPTAGQLLNEALIENKIKGVELFDSIVGVKPAPAANTPATSPEVDFDAPAFLKSVDEDGNNVIEWGQVVDRGGNAVMRDKAVVSINERDWNSYTDRIKRALIEQKVTDSMWGLARDKKQRIEDILKATNEWAEEMARIRAQVQQGQMPESPLQPEAEAPAPQPQPAAGGAGGQQPPVKPPVQPVQPQQPNQPSGKQPGSTSPQQQMPNMPPAQPSQKVPNMPPRATKTRNVQANMATPPGQSPAGAQGGNSIFSQKQFGWQKIVDDFRADAPKWAQVADTSKAARAAMFVPRQLYPEIGAWVPSAVIGKVYGTAAEQGGSMVKQATALLRQAMYEVERTGLKFATEKINGKDAQVIQGLVVKPETEWTVKDINGKPVPDQFKTMQNMALDVLSNPDFFKPTTTDPVLAKRQMDAVNNMVGLVQRMFTEMTNDAASRGIPINTKVRNAQYYIPRSVDETAEIEHLRGTSNAEDRRFVTATEGITDPKDTTTYFSTESSIEGYIRKVSARIAARETELALHDLLGARYVDELIAPSHPARIKAAEDALDIISGDKNAQSVENYIKRYIARGDRNFGTAIPPSVSWLNSQLDPSLDFMNKMYTLANEPDPNVRKTLASDIKDIVHDAEKRFAAELKSANKSLEEQREAITGGRRVDPQGTWQPKQGSAYVQVDALKNAPGDAKTLYLPSNEAAEINAWFGSPAGQKVIGVLNDVNTLNKLATQSLDIEMMTRLSGTILQDPKAYFKGLLWSFKKPGTMDRWMATPEIQEIINKGRRYGLVIDMNTEFGESFKDTMRETGPMALLMDDKKPIGKVNKQLQQLAAGAANYAQIMYLARELPRIDKAGRKAAARKGITSPEGIQREIDIQGRGAMRAFQDHMGFRSLMDSGVSPGARTLSRLLFMSGRKTAGWIHVPFNLIAGGEKGRNARMFYLTEGLMAAAYAAAIAATTALISGTEVDWEEFIDPSSPYFMTTTIGGMRIGPGGGVLRDIRQAGYTYKTAKEDPNRLAKVDWNNPLLGYAVTRGAAIPNIARSIATGKNFMGVPLDDPKSIGLETLSYVMPMSLQDTVQDSALKTPVGKQIAEDTSPGSVGIGTVLGILSQWTGGRSAAETPNMLLTKGRDAIAKQTYNTKWENLNQVQKWQLNKDNPELGQIEELMLEANAEKEYPMAMFELNLQDEYARLDAEAALYRAQYQAGQRPDGSKYTGANYRDDISKISRERAMLPAVIKGANPAYKDVPVTKAEKDAYYAKLGRPQNAVDKFIDAYYQISDDAIVKGTEGTTDQMDFDKLFADREALIARSNPLVVAQAMPYINRHKDPDILRAEQIYNEYMSLPKYDGVTPEQAEHIDAWKDLWGKLRDSGVPDPKREAYNRDPEGYRLYEKYGKQASRARREFKYANGHDSKGIKMPDGSIKVYTEKGYWINLFYGDLTLTDLLEAQPEMAEQFAD